MALVQQQGHEEGLGQHVGVQDPPEEDDQPAEWGGQLVGVDMVLVAGLQQQMELTGCPVPTNCRDDALNSKEPD